MKLPFHHDAMPGTFEYARLHKKSSTKAEATLWKALRQGRLKRYKFRRQHPVAGYIVDFYCHCSQLAIEIDGPIHDLNDNPEYDQYRTESLGRLGIRVIRFSNSMVLQNLDQVIKEICRSLRSSPMVGENRHGKESK